MYAFEPTTTITNAACEPEIVDLANFLNVCGARVVGAGTSFISITGVKRLHTTQYEPIPDRIVAGSYLAFCAINNGKIRLDNAIANDLVEPINVLKQMGCDVLTSPNAIKLQAPERLKAVNRIRTNPYPDFPTDLQSIFMSLLAVSEGKSVIEENVFENRFHNAGEINKLGGKVDNFRLTSGIGDGGRALGEHACHHNVFSCSHAGEFEIDVCRVHICAVAEHKVLFFADDHTHLAQGVKV